MKEIDPAQIFNIADKPNKYWLMRETISTLQQKPQLGFVLLHSVAAFIDGLMAAPSRKVGKTYCEYLEIHFPKLCSSIEANSSIGANSSGARIFYENIRCKAIHEFAPKPPLALGHADKFSNPTEYSERVTIDRTDWLLINVDLIASDFLEHLDQLS